MRFGIRAAITGFIVGILAASFLFLQKKESTAQPNPSVSKPRIGAPQRVQATALPLAEEPEFVLVLGEGISDQAARLVREATSSYSNKDYQKALLKAEAALQLDPENKEALVMKVQAKNTDEENSGSRVLDEANAYFKASEFAGAVNLYRKYMEEHPESKDQILPLIVKCYYNLGIIETRKSKCDIASQYFRQVLFIDQADQLSTRALALVEDCRKSEMSYMESRKPLALMEFRR